MSFIEDSQRIILFTEEELNTLANSSRNLLLKASTWTLEDVFRLVSLYHHHKEFVSALKLHILPQVLKTENPVIVEYYQKRFGNSNVNRFCKEMNELVRFGICSGGNVASVFNAGFFDFTLDAKCNPNPWKVEKLLRYGRYRDLFDVVRDMIRTEGNVETKLSVTDEYSGQLMFSWKKPSELVEKWMYLKLD